MKTIIIVKSVGLKTVKWKGSSEMSYVRTFCLTITRSIILLTQILTMHAQPLLIG